MKVSLNRFWMNVRQVLSLEKLKESRYRALAARIEAKDSFAWDVEVNQVKVGSISDADYAVIRHCVFSDVRVYVAQVANLLRVALNSFDYCYRAIPLGIFWIGVALAIFSPETISSVMAALQRATDADMRSAVGTAGSMLAIMMMVSVAFHWVLGMSRFGFINRFDEAVGTAVRKHCGVAAEGSVVLYRWVDGVHVFADAIQGHQPGRGRQIDADLCAVGDSSDRHPRRDAAASAQPAGRHQD